MLYRMKAFIAAVIGLSLAGCLTNPARGPEVYEGNEVSVVVGWNRSTVGSTGALAVAEAHCAKFGKHAQYSGKPNDFLLAYNCIK
jgi:outer membrane lipoprotein SlyB